VAREEVFRVDGTGLKALLVAIARLDHATAANLLAATPTLVTATLTRREEFFVAERLAQAYEGDTALHAAGFSYDPELARELVHAGADIRAKNRRGAEPLHAAVIGVPGSATWNPTRQRAVIRYFVEVGADPNAPAAGGVTPLHAAWFFGARSGRAKGRSRILETRVLRVGFDRPPRVTLNPTHGTTTK
jgi:hypothetical protein